MSERWKEITAAVGVLAFYISTPFAFLFYLHLLGLWWCWLWPLTKTCGAP